MSTPTLSWTLKETVEFNPVLKEVLKNVGFDQVDNPQLMNTLGATITLAQAAATKNIDGALLLKQIEAALETSGDVTLGENASREDGELFIAGLLPCPVRVPLMEAFEEYAASSPRPLKYVLKAASEGAAWVEEHLQNFEDPTTVPDLFISAGFELYFDKKKMGALKERGVFKDFTPFSKGNAINSDFDGLDLVDPDGHYSIIATVPAVFLVNKDELGDAPMPKTWKDILDPRFAGRVSLPVSDFDLFNAIILTIQKNFGDQGVRDLGRSMATDMHPAEMVKGGKGKATRRPAVTIMPYFFTRMAKGNGPMQAVWPEDGAIISPIFMLAKAEKQNELQPIVDLFASKATAETLAHKGLFPTLHPEVDNQLPENTPWQWLGWDYIREKDLSVEIERTIALFEQRS